jgi:hypothetical protein
MKEDALFATQKGAPLEFDLTVKSRYTPEPQTRPEDLEFTLALTS